MYRTKYDVNWSGHSRHKSHSQPVQCTRPSHCLRPQWRHNPIQHSDVTIATQRTLLRAHVNGTEIVLKSTDRRSNISLFLYVQGLIHGSLIICYIKGNQMNLISEMWRILLLRILQKIRFTVLTKTVGVIANDGILECIVFVQCTLYNARWRDNALPTIL